MASNSTLGRFQALARGAGFGPTDRETSYAAGLHKKQTDEHDTAALDAAVASLDTWKKRVGNDWTIFTESSKSGGESVMPKGFTGTPQDYVDAHRQSMRNLDEHKYILPSDIVAMYDNSTSIDYENDLGISRDILGPGKFMNSVTSKEVENEKGTRATNYQVRSVDPETGQMHDANPTFGGKSEAALAEEGGDEAVAKGSWPPVSNAVRDKVFTSFMAKLYARSPGSSRSMLNFATRSVGENASDPIREAKEQEMLQLIVDSGGEEAVEAQKILDNYGTNFRAQEQTIDKDFATAQTAEREKLTTRNEGIRKNNEKLVEAARRQARNPEGDGYGLGGTDDPNTPDVNEALPMGKELWDRLPKFIVVGQQGGFSLEDYTLNDDMVGMENYVAVKDAIPLNMTRAQWGSLRSWQRAQLQVRHDALVARNLHTAWRGTVSRSEGKVGGDTTLAEEIEAYDKAGVPGGMGVKEHDKTLKDVKEFWDKFNARGQRSLNPETGNMDWKEGSDRANLMDFLRNNPGELAAFKESPFKFAQNHMVEDAVSITGGPANADEIIAANVKGVIDEVDIKAAVAAMARPAGTLTQAHMDTLRAEAAKLTGAHAVKQDEMAALIEKQQQNNGDLNKEERAGIMLGVISTFPEGDPRFGQLLQSTPSWVERGTWDNFTQTFEQENVRLEQYDRGLNQAQENINLRSDELELNKIKLTQQQYEFQVGIAQDQRAAVDSAMGGSPYVRAAVAQAMQTQFGKNLYQIGDDFDPDLETAYTPEGFRAYISTYNAMTNQHIEATKGIPEKNWTPQMRADEVAIKSGLVLGVKQFLRAEEARNTGLWTKLVTLLPWVTRDTVGSASLDEVSQLVAFKKDHSTAEKIGEVAYYKHVNPRTMREQGEPIPAFSLHKALGEYGGRELLWSLSVGNREKFNSRQGK